MRSIGFGASRFDPFGPGMPAEEKWGQSTIDRKRRKRNRSKEAQQRRAAKRWARRKNITLKAFIKEHGT